MSQILGGKPLVSYADAHAVKKPVGPKERFEKLKNEPLRVFIRTQLCILAGLVDRHGIKHICVGAVVCCHLKTKNSKGGDDDNVFPGCGGINGCHQEQEGHTKEFEYKWQLRLKPICRKLTAAFYAVAKHGPHAR